MNETKEKISLGEYKIIDVIGSGGFGIVYKVKHPNGEIFAAKVPHCRYGKFKEEVSALEGLIHKNIIGYRGAYKGNKPPFYLMPYVPNGSLEQAKKPIDTELALIIAHQILEGLKYAHEKKYIHGDLKPSNILLGKEAMIADFGLVSQADPSSFANTLNTVSTKITGTYDYMSPEQKEGIIDKRNDIYSTGVILYNMLTNRLVTNARKPSELNKNVPKRVDNIVLKAMDNIDDRYQTAEEFRKDVEALLNKSPKTQIKDCLSARYVPVTMLPKDKKAYLPEIEKILKRTKAGLEHAIMRKVENAIGCHNPECDIISKYVNVKIKKHTLNEMTLQYYPVELSEDEESYKNLNGKKIIITPKKEGFLIKRAIETCKKNKEWDMSPETGSFVKQPEKGVKFNEPVWHHPKNHIPVDLELNIEVRYEIKKTVITQGQELNSATVKQTWTAKKDYEPKANIFFTGTERFWDATNSIKLDDLVLKSSEPEIEFYSEPNVPYHVHIIAGSTGTLATLLTTSLLIENFGAVLLSTGILGSVFVIAAHCFYAIKYEDEINMRKKKLKQEKERFRLESSSDLNKKISIELNHLSGTNWE